MGFSFDTLLARAAIVTGASQGIGRAITTELAAVGGDAVRCSRRPVGTIGAVIFVASERAEFTTGGTLHLIGGSNTSGCEDERHTAIAALLSTKICV